MVLYVKRFLGEDKWYLTSNNVLCVGEPVIYFRAGDKQLHRSSPTYFPNRQEATLAGMAMGFEVLWVKGEKVNA